LPERFWEGYPGWVPPPAEGLSPSVVGWVSSSGGLEPPFVASCPVGVGRVGCWIGGPIERPLESAGEERPSWLSSVWPWGSCLDGTRTIARLFLCGERAKGSRLLLSIRLPLGPLVKTTGHVSPITSCLASLTAVLRVNKTRHGFATLVGEILVNTEFAFAHGCRICPFHCPIRARHHLVTLQ
jgi:hypothetical protein